MSRRDGETLFALMLLPVTFPGVLFVLGVEKLFDRMGKARPPEFITFLGCVLVIALFWWTMNQIFNSA